MSTVEIYEIDGELYLDKIKGVPDELIHQRTLHLHDGYYSFIAWLMEAAKQYGVEIYGVLKHDEYAWPVRRTSDEDS